MDKEGFNGMLTDSNVVNNLVSPNPVTADVTVSANQAKAKDKTSRKTITEIRIYDQQGQVRKHQKFGKADKATISVSNLAIGIYTIEISDGAKVERQQLSIVK